MYDTSPTTTGTGIWRVSSTAPVTTACSAPIHINYNNQTKQYSYVTNAAYHLNGRSYSSKEYEEFLLALYRHELNHISLLRLLWLKILHWIEAGEADHRQRCKTPVLRCFVVYGLGERPRTPGPRAPPFAGGRGRARMSPKQRSLTIRLGLDPEIEPREPIFAVLVRAWRRYRFSR